MPLIPTSSRTPTLFIDKTSKIREVKEADELVETSDSKSLHGDMLSPIVRSTPSIENCWSCNWPVLVAEDPSEISSCSTQLLVLKNELPFTTWDDNSFAVAAMKATWSLILHAYTGTGRICFGYMSPTESPHIFACDLSHIQTSAKLIELAQESQRRHNFPLPSNELETDVCNTALSVLYEDGPSITEASGPLFKQDLKNALSAIVRIREAEIILDLNHSPSRVPIELARHVSHTFKTILQSFVRHPSQPLSNIEMLSEQDHLQISQWNENVPPVLHQKLHEAFTQKALDNPNVPAISSWEGEWTYAELDHASTNLGEHLAFLHTRYSASQTVLLCFDKSCAGIIAILAILKAGLTCVPVDPESGFKKVVEEVNPQLLCTSRAQADRYTDFNGEVVIVDVELLHSLEESEQTSKLPLQSSNDVAFIQYTGGVTGSPKGVNQGHTGLYTGILAQSQATGYDVDSRVLHSNLYSTSAGITEVFGAFFYVACVVIVPEEESLELVTEMINEQRVTHACFTPTEARNLEPMDLWQLRTVTLAGEGFMQEDVEKWGLETELIRTYGTAETCVHVSASKAPSPYLFDLFNIGNPFLASFWVVEQGNVQKLAPIGAVGELVIGGPTLALGYIESTAETSTEFLVNPNWAIPSREGCEQRFFTTGDLVRHLGNGEYVFCGRKRGTSYDETEFDNANEHISPEIPPLSLLGSIELADEAMKAAVAICGISSDMIEDIYPTTPMQEGLFALSSKQKGAFMKQDIFELPSNLDIGKFCRAWSSTIQQFPVLRTRFFMTDSLRVLQVVVSESPSCQDVSDLHSYLEQDLKKPMLWGEPLFRYAISMTPGRKPHLVLTMHHALFDGWALGLIFDRVKQNFDENPVLTGTSFNCFVKYVQEVDRERMNHFWTEQLDNASAIVFPALPAANYQPTPNDTFERNIDFKRSAGSPITASTLVQAAWSLTVAAYADSKDITFGSTVFGRAAPIPGIVDMMGPTVTTVPFRMQVFKDTKLGTFVQQVQNQSAMTIPYEQAGMYHIKNLTAGTQTACSFQTALLVQHLNTASGLEALGCRRMNEMRDAYQPYALNVEVGLQDDGAVLSVLFDNNVIDKLQVGRIINMFSETLRKISIESSDVILDDIMAITTHDIHELNTWNQVPPDPVQEAVHQAFNEKVLLNPKAPAIASWDGDLTYAELDFLSNRLADHLLTLGIKVETIVPLHFEKSKWAIVSMLAVLKAGGTCLSFDVSHPPDRLRDMVKAVDARIMLAGKTPPSKVVDCVDQMISVNEDLFEILGHRGLRQFKNVAPHNRAFIVFTSGSTGSPKGIELEHQAVCTSSRAYAAAVNIGTGSRCLQYSSFAFDVHITDIFTALMSGACCCIPSEEDRMSNLPQAMNNLGVNHVDITPTVASLFRPEDVPNLKSMVVGGEPVTTETARRWGDQVMLVNMYSQSETSNWVTHHVVRANTQQPSNIGLGGGVCTWVVDQHNDSRLAPIGCIGELFVEGPVLARGYLNDPEKTEASFVIDPPWLPTASPPGRRLYRTGDLVRCNSDGTLVYIGRRDAQIKLHGQRLELTEVDHKMMEISLIRTCLAVLPKTGLCQGRCVAVLSLRDFEGDESGLLRMIDPSHRVAVSAQLATIRDRLSESLARWMIPTFWIVVGDLPTNVSGKLDRNKARSFVENLSEDDFQQASDLIVDSHFQAPEASMEIFLQGIWSSILKLPLDQISAAASFLRLGGDSITAMQVVSKCRAEGVTLSVHDVLISKSLSELANLADTSSKPTNLAGKIEEQSVPNPPSEGKLTTQGTAVSDGLYDSIFNQASVKPPNVERAMLASDYQVSALEQMLLSFRGDLTYHTFDIPKPVDWTRLALSCVELVNCHPLLRSVFVSHKRQLYQVILRSSFVDLTDRVDQPELATLIEDDRKLKFCLGQPMVWFKLVRRDYPHNCESFVMRLPHCLYDAPTLASLVSDLEQAYFNTNTLKQPVDISPYITYRDKLLPKALSYWRQYLEGSTASQIFHIHSLKAYGITSATVVKAAWGFLLTELCGQDDVVFGELVSGRGLAVSGIESLDIVCASTVPLRVKLDSSWTVLDLLESVQERQLASMPFEFAGSIVKECTSWPRWSRFGSVINHIPLPATNYVEDKTFKSTGIHGNLNPSSDLNIQSHPLHVTSELDPNFQVQITFDEDHITPVLVDKALHRFCGIIRLFTTDVTSSLGSLREGPIDGYILPYSCNNAPLNGSEAVVDFVPSTDKKAEKTLKTVRSVWETVIGQSDEMDIPFFAYWGALIAAAHFVVAYQQVGFDLTMEDILKSPTIRAQVNLCANN
ncbi:tRNA (adenine(58)-N(1))-methyltransferase catalytic subunit trm61 [Penicillium atrosanguineum]|uniref:tRNA (adenine(58)-N(1))-methyltransferase catalytic subunit trm61 n=1 Tax=Penicillium atrosanguineum TaxID=1132637 RepID=UPI002397D79D|nr:tRNA (adenine(58)-N(1))-methyltransferase catalytic subunit trm61 [Penicillium atrosanguineum]KAJ5304325.1 tRNA (adenine(58)-N(1))-methyltransferase catalytic subunit trm61 [Penicillium atrosanguineum]